MNRWWATLPVMPRSVLPLHGRAQASLVEPVSYRQLLLVPPCKHSLDSRSGAVQIMLEVTGHVTLWGLIEAGCSASRRDAGQEGTQSG